MGSGSFGGGSGSFGGGSGSTGGGGSSVHDKIAALSDLTRNINLNPAIAPTRARIYELLQDGGKVSLLKGVMRDPAFIGTYQKMLGLTRTLKEGGSLSTFAAAQGVAPTASLDRLARKIVQKCSDGKTDERVDRAAQMAVRYLFQAMVGNDDALYHEAELRGLALDAAPLSDTAGAFLLSLFDVTVRSDLLRLSDDARAAISTACSEIARRWLDKFRDEYRKETPGGFRGVFEAIAEHYGDFAGGGGR